MSILQHTRKFQITEQDARNCHEVGGGLNANVEKGTREIVKYRLNSRKERREKWVQWCKEDGQVNN